MIAILHRLRVANAHVFRNRFLAEISLCLINEYSFYQGSGKPPDSISPLSDEGPGRGDRRVRIGTTEVGGFGKNIKTGFAREDRHGWLRNETSNLFVLDCRQSCGLPAGNLYDRHIGVGLQPPFDQNLARRIIGIGAVAADG